MVAATTSGYSPTYCLKLPRFRGHRTIWFEESTMAKTRAAYPAEFRRQMVELVHAGRTPEELAHEFEPTAQSIRNWVAQWERNAGRGDGGLTTAEREELSRLRRENRQLRLEREILSKAAAWFARETNAIPPKGSGS
jgi:transposase